MSIEYKQYQIRGRRVGAIGVMQDIMVLEAKSAQHALERAMRLYEEGWEHLQPFLIVDDPETRARYAMRAREEAAKLRGEPELAKPRYYLTVWHGAVKSIARVMDRETIRPDGSHMPMSDWVDIEAAKALRDKLLKGGTK